MQANKKVMIACSTYSGMDKYLTKYVAGVRQQTFQDFELVFCDNSPNDEYAEKLREFGTVIRSPSVENINEALELSYNKLREHFLVGNYSYMWILEADQVPLNNALERLIKADKDVVGCPYLLNPNNDNICVHDFVKETLYTVGDLKLKAEQQGSIVKVWGCGHGAVLAKRKVIEAVDFRINKRSKRSAAPDTFWYEDLKKLGIEVFCLSDCYTEHLRVTGNMLEYPAGVKLHELPEITVVRCRGDFWNNGINPKFFILKGQKKVLPRIIDDVTFRALQDGLLVSVDPAKDFEARRLFEEETHRRK